MHRICILIAIIIAISNFIFGVNSVKVSIKSQNADLCIRVRDLRKVELDKCHWMHEEPVVRKKLEAEQIFDIHPTDVPEEGQDDEVVEKSSLFIIRLSTQKKNGCLSALSSTITLEKCQLRKSRFRISGMILRNHSKSCQTTTTFEDFRYKLQLHASQSCLDVSMPSLKSRAPRMGYLIGPSECSSVKSIEELKTDPQLWQLCTQNGNCSLSLDDLAWSSFVKTDTLEVRDKVVDCIEKESTTTSLPITETIGGAVFSNHSSNGTEDHLVIADSGCKCFHGLSTITIANFVFWSLTLFLPCHFII